MARHPWMILSPALRLALLMVVCRPGTVGGALVKSESTHGSAFLLAHNAASKVGGQSWFAPAPAFAYSPAPQIVIPSSPSTFEEQSDLVIAMNNIKAAKDSLLVKETSRIRASTASLQVGNQLVAGPPVDAEIAKQADFYNLQLYNMHQTNMQHMAFINHDFNRQAQEVFDGVRSKASQYSGTAVNNAVKQVEEAAESNTITLVNQAESMEEEGAELSKKAAEAATISRGASKAAAEYIDALPKAEADEALSLAKDAADITLKIRDQAFNTKRYATLIGQRAQYTLHEVQQADALSKRAEDTALKAVEQAHANAKLLRAIKEEAEKARQLFAQKLTGVANSDAGVASAPAPAIAQRAPAHATGEESDMNLFG